MLLGVGAVATKTYVDDVFSTFLYKGNNTNNHHIQNGIDLTEGGVVWIKDREQTSNFTLTDSAYLMGTTNKDFIQSNTSNAAQTGPLINSFESNGFKLSGEWYANSAYDYSSWTFRKAPGFFDVVTYTGNGSNRTIAHSLGSVPGMIMVKRTDTSADWLVYHRNAGGSNPGGWSYLFLNTTAAVANATSIWNDTDPTSSVFSVGTDNYVNANGGTYVAYVFAGGESTAATARSVDFDGTNDELTCSESYIPNTDSSTNFCLETWVKTDNDGSSWEVIYSQYVGSGSGRMLFGISGNKIVLDLDGMSGTFNTGENSVFGGQWYHVAWTFDGTTHRLFLNGELKDTNVPANFSNGIGQSNPRLGGIIHAWSSFDLDGKLSNFRITHGQAVYTSSFRPPTEPLTTTSQGVTGSNCKLLCCNNSTITNNDGSSGTLTVSGDLTASTDSPFDDPAGFVFGDAEDQNVIKCGSYVGNSTANHEIYVGWEPQWWLVKNVTDSQNWQLLDSMRGWAIDGNDQYLVPNNTSQDHSFNFGNPTSTGFNLSNASSNWQNQDGKTYVYIAIRRPDGYCGKPPELGTDVFAMDTSAATGTIPDFDSGFPVDFSFFKGITTTDQWYTGARIAGQEFLGTNTTAAGSTSGSWVWDSNVGWIAASGFDSNHQAWMWKRYAGFDVVAYKGNGSEQNIMHNLSKSPEMIWCKGRDVTSDWAVYHKGQNGGTNPEQYHLHLNNTSAEVALTSMWNDTAPTSTQFTVGSNSNSNYDNKKFIAMLFASVDGISKVGRYTGTGSSGNSVSLGFQPRFLIVKNADWSSGDWFVYDTTRGWVSGNDSTLILNSNAAQVTGSTFDIDPTSTGFTVQSTDAAVNNNGHNFIYYAHA